MKRKIPFNLFGEKQEIFFDIDRLEELELIMGKSIQQVINSENEGIIFCLKALPICLNKEGPKFYKEKIMGHFESGGKLSDISAPIIHAIFATGVLGKIAADTAMSIYYPELYSTAEETETKKRVEDGENKTVQSFHSWLLWAETIAYGPLNMLPDALGKLQPYEFLQQWEGYQWRKKARESELAYFTCHLMNVSGKELKKPVSPADLLEQNQEKPEKESQEEYLKERFKHML